MHLFDIASFASLLFSAFDNLLSFILSKLYYNFFYYFVAIFVGILLGNNKYFLINRLYAIKNIIKQAKFIKTGALFLVMAFT